MGGISIFSARPPPPTPPHHRCAMEGGEKERPPSEKRECDELQQLQTRYRRGRHRAGDLGCARPVDERDRPQGDRGTLCHHRAGGDRHGDQGRGHHLRQRSVLRRRRPDHAGDLRAAVRGGREGARRGGGRGAHLRGEPQMVGALPAARDQRQAVGGGDQWHGARWRLRVVSCLPSSRRRRHRQDARRVARGQGRVVSGRRRDAAHRPHDGAWRRAAIPAQGRRTRRRAGEGDEARRRGRAGERSHCEREGVDQDGRQGQGALGRGGVPKSGRRGLFQGRDADLPAGERDLSARDLRQLSGRARHHAGGVRRAAASLRSCAARRVALVRAHPAHAAGGGHDPHAVRLDAGIEQGRAPAEGRAGDEAEKNRRARRGLHGCGHRLCQRAGRTRGGADRPRPGERRQGQGAFRQADDRPGRQGPRQRSRAHGPARAHHADARLRRAQGLRSGDRGGVRGPQGQGRSHRESRSRDRRRRGVRLQYLDLAYQLRSPKPRSGRRSSSACISSRRSSA